MDGMQSTRNFWIAMFSSFFCLSSHTLWALAFYFLRLTQYNADAHNTHAHSSLWIYVGKPYPYEHLRRTEHRQICRFSKSLLAPRRRRERRLPLNVTPEIPRINPGKGVSTIDILNLKLKIDPRHRIRLSVNRASTYGHDRWCTPHYCHYFILYSLPAS
jgi:hypothetical protein